MSQQSFPKLMQLQGATQLLFCMVLRKLKFLKVSSWSRKGQTSKHNWCFMQSFRSSSFKDVEKFIQTVYYSGKEEQSLTETRVRLY